MNVKQYLPWVALVVMAWGVTSCASTSRYRRDFNSRKTSLEYLHDTPQQQKEYAQKVHIAKPVVTDTSFTRLGVVRTARAYVIPAILYIEWNLAFDYNLGSASIQQDVGSFVRSAVMTESRRSGIFTPDTARTADGWVLEIEIDSIGAVGQYLDRGVAIWIFFDQESGIGDSKAYVQCRYRLRRGDTILKEDVVYSEQIPHMLGMPYKSSKVYRADFNASLIEALSLSFKDDIEKIVQDVNGYIRLK
jgi:hypothetical protein